MSRQQDQFIDDDEEEVCPLCVEELDLTDKGFRPCPCGYQICQFCYNNVKHNMNGLCPACRRPYNDKDVEITKPTAEELTAYKARQAQKQKKTQVAMQKEKQKAEADNLSRKHLAGLRVVQKNLVYVTGLQPATQEDQLLQTLRGHDYFGQYGKIIKIVVSKAKDPAHPNSVGVYVTFERREDAEKCIQAVNGSKNHERTLRAQFGTTKYCSAYLRGENCGNRNCMFLHEPGEANESYSRADLSALNAGSSQHGIGRPPPQSQQPVASASQPMVRQSSEEQASSPPSRPALPSTASWAARVPQVRPTRPESRATNSTTENEVVEDAPPVPASTDHLEHTEPPTAAPEPDTTEAPARQLPSAKPAPRREVSPLTAFIKNFNPDDLRLRFCIESIPQAYRDIIVNYPPLFDPNGGAKRRVRRQREEEQRRMEQQAQAFEQPPAVEADENPELSGSLQLGGEPEDRLSISQPLSAIQPPGQDERFPFGGIASPGLGERGLTPQQQQQLALNSIKSPSAQSSASNTFGQQGVFQQPPGHQRNASRYSFANDLSASTTVKPVANAKVMNQQSSMMPPTGGNHFGAQHPPHGSQFYTSNVQGPPPGIKMTGTPPVSGGMTFGQGHGFATGGLQYGANAGHEERMRSLLRGREASVGGSSTLTDASKHDTEFPPLAPPSRQQSISLSDVRRSTPPVPPGLEGSESRRSTPTVPPGLNRQATILDNESASGSRPSSRAGVKRTVSQITPALPLRPATPVLPHSKAPALQQDQNLPSNVGTSGTPKQESTDVLNKTSVSKDVEDKPHTPKKTTTVRPTVPESSGEALQEALSTVEPAKDAQNIEKSHKTLPSSPTAARTSGTRTFQPASKGQATVQTSETQAIRQTPTKQAIATAGAPKRTPPGKLDIAAAAHASSTSAEVDTPTRAQKNVGQTPIESTLSRSPSGSISSPAIRGPRTLRVVSTPKTETTPTASATTPTESTPTTARQPSRQPSIASIQIPGTPSSEQVSISDNVSVPSTSQSRANSPPPPLATGKTSSGPTKTKNQLKKERQERAKALEEEKKVEEEKKAEEPAQEAIVSRKKKTKREKESKPKPKAAMPTTEQSTLTASRAPSPPPKPIEEVMPAEPEPAAPVPKSPEPPAPASTQTPPVSIPHEPSPPPTPSITAAQIIADLKATAPEIQKCLDSLFRSPTSTHYKPTSPITPKDLENGINRQGDFVLNLTTEEIDGLLKGSLPAVRYGGTDKRTWSRGMVTPTGAHLRALAEELEVRFLELEKAIQDLPDELRFRPTKPQNDLRLPSFDLEALRRNFENLRGRGVSVMEQMMQDGAAPRSGVTIVDDVEKYVNEFVMPPATPPPGSGTGSGAAIGVASGGVSGRFYDGAGTGQSGGEALVPSLDLAERQLSEARRVVDEREGALKKMMKKNRKVLGLG